MVTNVLKRTLREFGVGGNYKKNSSSVILQEDIERK